MAQVVEQPTNDPRVAGYEYDRGKYTILPFFLDIIVIVERHIAQILHRNHVLFNTRMRAVCQEKYFESE